MGLGTFKQFTAGTKAVATEVNDNFDAITAWANGNITSDNIGELNDVLQFNLTTDVNGITISNSGDKTSLKITQSDELDNGESVIEIDNSTIDQLGTDSADLKIKAKASSTIPSLLVSHGIVETLKLTKTSLNLLGNTTLVYSTRIKIPVQTTVQRNALVSPETASLLYDSTTQQLNEKRSDGWAPVGPPVGSVQMFAGSSAPEGWVLCDGTTLDSVANPKYAALFAVISTTYGGTGAASFKVPNCRGVFVRGAGSQTIGAETYTATLGVSQNDATAKNGLTITDPGHNHTLYWGSAFRGGGGESVPRFDAGWEQSNANQAIGSKTTGITLNNGDAETRPANIALNYIIKY